MSRKPALTVAIAASFLALTLTYALARVVQDHVAPDPDPALVVWSTRIGMYWRLAIGGYVGAIVAPLAYVWARRDLVTATRVLALAVPLVALGLAAQGAFVP